MYVPKNIILTRNDGIGDMVLMLPMCAVIKEHYPEMKIAVLGKAYTKALVEACIYADEFIDENDFFKNHITVGGEKPEAIIHVRTNKAVAKRAKALKIPLRIGTKSRVYHWTTCNKLVSLGRKKSDLHEAQLNLKLLQPIGISKFYSTEELGRMYGLEKIQPLAAENFSLLQKDKYNLIIHPKSQGSSREWPISHFISLINMLGEDRFNIILSGVEKERPYIDKIKKNINREVNDIAGKLPLSQFLSLIKNADGIVANATGPVHLGAALGVDTLGLYPPIRPIHPGRWKPLGPKVQVFVLDKECSDCRKKKDFCQCIMDIHPEWLASSLETLADKSLTVGR